MSKSATAIANTNIFNYLSNEATTSPVPEASAKYYSLVTASVVIAEGNQRYNTKVTFIVCFNTREHALKAQRRAFNAYKDGALKESGYFFCNAELKKVKAFIQSKLRKQLILVETHAFAPGCMDADCPAEVCDLS